MSPDQPVFFYDLADAACYLAAERIMTELPVIPEWEPVLASEIGAAPADIDREAIERLAETRGVQPFRWPASWPPDSRQAVLAATYAKQIGRAVAFSLAAFRQEFAGGRDLGDTDTVLIAAAACEMHPSAVLKSLELRSVLDALERACQRARAAGVGMLPAVQVGRRAFEGEDAIDAAAETLGGRV